MQLTLEAIQNDIVPAGNEMLNEWIREVADDDDFTWINKVFKVNEKTSWKTGYASRKGGRLWPEWKENEPDPVTEWEDIERFTAVPTIFKDSFLITELRLRYGMDAGLPVETLILNDMEFFTRDLIQNGFLQMPNMAAGVLLNAFDSAEQTIRDGTALCADTHTDVPFDNKLTTKLSPQLLKEANNARHYLDSKGVPKSFSWDTIVIGPKNEDYLDELLFSRGKVDTNNNNINVYANRYKKVVCNYLNEDIQTGASEYVFFVDSRKANLFGDIHEMPHFQSPFQKDSETFQLPARTIFTFYPVNNAGILGSDGTTNPT